MNLFEFVSIFVSLGQAGPPPLINGIVHYHREVPFKNALAKRYFDQGLAELYGFHKSASERSFAEASRLEPSAAMAWWGKAAAFGPDINNPAVSENDAKQALEDLARASAVANPGVEADLVHATDLRFSVKRPIDQLKLDLDYAEAMGRLSQKYPKDPDILSLYAESEMILNPWDQWFPDGSPRMETINAIAALNRAIAVSPDHLMANHLLIHVFEASPDAGQALESANRMCTLAPSLGHLVHMPSHIYIHLGMWNEAIHQNELAIQSDLAFYKNRTIPQSYAHYVDHNRMMLSYAACMNGSYAKAIRAVNEVTASELKRAAGKPLREPDVYLYYPLEVFKRFGKWKQILSYPKPGKSFPLSLCFWFGDRAIALAALDQPAKAAQSFDDFAKIRRSLPGNDLLAIEDHQARGELFVQRKQWAQGIEELKRAVQCEDAQGYDEPPRWIQPTRDTLGAALVEEGSASEAVKVYSQDLKRVPKNGWAMIGMSRALAAEGEHKLATEFRKRYLSVWSKVDPKTTTSCLCLSKAK
jgi:tetratricopeptide (TPR) repeat protein